MPCYWWRQKIYPIILIIIFFPITKTQWFSEGSKAQDFVKVVDQFWHFLIDCDLKRIQLAAILQVKNEKDWHCTEKKVLLRFTSYQNFRMHWHELALKTMNEYRVGAIFYQSKTKKFCQSLPYLNYWRGFIVPVCV